MSYSIFICIFVSVILSIVSICIWIQKIYINKKIYQFSRNIGTIFLLIYALVSINRFASGDFINEQNNFEFLQEPFGIIIFWILFPPIWFFVEYWAFESETINGYNYGNLEKQKKLETIKSYSDFSSKIWAGILAFILFYISVH